MNKRRKVMNRIAAWLMCLAMVWTTIIFPAFTTTKVKAAECYGVHDFSENGTCACGLTQVTYEVIEGTKTVRITGPKTEYIYTDAFFIPSTIKIGEEDYIVTEIAANAFEGFEFMGSLTLGNNVTTIGENAFAHSKFKGDLYIPEGVTTIGENAFSGCKFVNVYIPDSVTEISAHAFIDCFDIEVSAPCSKAYLEFTLPAYKTFTTRDHDFVGEDGINDEEKLECSICHRKNIGYKGIDILIPSPLYNGAYQEPTVTITNGDTVLEQGRDYDVRSDSEVDFSRDGYSIIIIGTGEYAGTINDTWFIQKATPTGDILIWTLRGEPVYEKNQSKVMEVNARPGVEGLGIINVRYLRTDVENESLKGDGPTDAGTYDVYVMIEEGNNYNSISSGNMLKLTTFTIEKAANTIAPATPIIDEANIFDTKVIITAPDDNDYEYSMDGSEWQFSNIFEGLNPYQEYNFYQRYAATNNYNASSSSSAKVVTTKKSALTVTTVPSITGTYGTTLSDMTLSKTTDISDNGVAGTWSITQSGANTIYPTVDGTTPYEITFTPSSEAYEPITKMVVPTVDKKSISLTINDAERKYQEENPEFSIDQTDIASKLVGSDTYDSLGITLTTTATKNSEAGSYPITANYTNENYNITFTNGDLTISKATSSIAFNGYAPGRTYNGEKLANPTAEQLTLVGGAISDVDFVWYKDSVAETNKLTEAPKDAGNYYLVATVHESKNTSTSTATSEIITITKAVPSAEEITVNIPNNLSAVCGSSLSSVSLPSVFQWTDDNTLIVGGDLEAGQTITRKAKYTPSDSRNYESVDNVELNIVVTHSLTSQVSDLDHTKHISSCSKCNKDFVQADHDFVKEDSTCDSTKAICSMCGIKNIAYTGIDISITAPTYIGAGVVPTVTVKNGEVVLVKGIDYALSVDEQINVSTDGYTLTIAGLGDYAGKVVLGWNINKATATIATAPTAQTELIYDGTAQSLVEGGTSSTGTVVYSTTENGTYASAIPTETNAGSYSVWYKVEGIGNYKDSEPVEISVTIAPKDITGATITLGDSLTYSGETQTQTVSAVKLNEFTVDYTVSNNTAKNAGIYTLTVTGKGNFTGTATKEFTVAKATLVPNTPGTSKNASIKSGKKVSDITLPSDWVWTNADKNTALPTVADETVTATAIYAGTDATNYTDAAKSVSITITMSACAHPEAKVHEVVDTEPTCTEAGVKHKVCDECGLDIEMNITIAALGHNYDAPTISWSDDLSKAVGSFACERADCTHKENVNAVVTSATKDGFTTYTATVAFGGKTFTDVRVIVGTEDDTTRIVIETGINEIPDSLVEKGLDTEEKILEKMLSTVTEKVEGYTSSESEIMDVVFQMSTEDETAWVPVTPDNFPTEGLVVTIPYPEGTNADDFDFVITHMVTIALNGLNPGDVELPAVTKTAKGIQFTVKSLSPIGVSWKALEGSQEPTDPIEPGNEDVGAGPYDNRAWLIALLASLGLFVTLGSFKRTREEME